MLKKILSGSLFCLVLGTTGMAQAASWQVLGGSVYVDPDLNASSPAFSATLTPGTPGLLIEGSYQGYEEIFANQMVGTDDPDFAWNHQMRFYTGEYSNSGAMTPAPSIDLGSGYADLSSFGINWYEVNFNSDGATNVPIIQNPDGSYHLSWQMVGGFSSTGTATMTMDIAAVPVPAAVWLLGSGLVALVGIGRRARPRS